LKVLLVVYTESDEFLMVVERDKAEVPRPRLVAWLEYELWLCSDASKRPPPTYVVHHHVFLVREEMVLDNEGGSVA
jgi:hypothetical protein